jgi:hypothetical protein
MLKKLTKKYIKNCQMHFQVSGWFFIQLPSDFTASCANLASSLWQCCPMSTNRIAYHVIVKAVKAMVTISAMT